MITGLSGNEKGGQGIMTRQHQEFCDPMANSFGHQGARFTVLPATFLKIDCPKVAPWRPKNQQKITHFSVMAQNYVQIRKVPRTSVSERAELFFTRRSKKLERGRAKVDRNSFKKLSSIRPKTGKGIGPKSGKEIWTKSGKGIWAKSGNGIWAKTGNGIGSISGIT